MGPAKAVQDELMAIPDFGDEDDTLFAYEKKMIRNFKKAILLVAGTAVQKFMMTLEREQEVLMNIADMAIKTYITESVFLRVEKMAQQKGAEAIARQLDMARVYLYDTADIIQKAGKDAINAMAEGDEQKLLFIGLRRFTKAEPYNVKEARRRVAAAMIEANGYVY
jgi:hypothetical protein